MIPGAESLDDFGARLRGAIENIVASVPAGSAAVAFAHGALIGQLCSMATESRPFAFIHADNGSISRLVIQGDGAGSCAASTKAATWTPRSVRSAESGRRASSR
ncbi:MAG TPA: histidine phosphatase family protein, partial [Solirubrobacterales bacterium]|nr:histidine phosphatase family protein [Solirubrobacterales bacterium]